MLHFNPKFLLPFRFYILILLFFFTTESFSQVFTIDTLVRNGHRSNRVNIAYLAEGYTNAQLGTMVTNATSINNALFSQSPFLEYSNYFNAYCIKSVSAESGAKHPRTASDEASSNNQPAAAPNNIFGTTFDYGSIHRLLVPVNSSKIFDVLAQNLPDFDLGFVVTNSPFYGGSGGAVATASTDPSSAEVAIHEIGHSFAGLADEYWAGDNYAAEKPNMTRTTDPTTVKWKNWYNVGQVGIYQHGTVGISANWYKPHQNCKMQFLGRPFCAVCSETIIDRIHEVVNMIDAFSPAVASFTLPNAEPTTFLVDFLNNDANTVSLKWYLNGAPIAQTNNLETISIPSETFITGYNLVKAEVIDNTAKSRSFLPAAGYVNSQTWTVNKPAVLPIKMKSFNGQLVNKNAVLNWEIDNSNDLKHFILEKSKDGRNFTTAATINGEALRNRYSYTDINMHLPFSYYRIKAVEKDGGYTLSGVVRIQNAFERLAYKVYQDADLHKYHLSVGLNAKENISIKVLDAAGKQVFRKSFGLTEQQLEYDLNLQGKSAGIYFLNILVGNTNYTVQLLAK